MVSLEDEIMIDQNCKYCVEGDLAKAVCIKICDLPVSKVYLYNEQTHKGRCIVAYKDHVGDLSELSSEERGAFFDDVARVSRAIQKAFHPGKVNYGAYADKDHHLHFHLVPKYENEAEWGNVFAMNPDKVYLTEEEYGQIIEQIKANL